MKVYRTKNYIEPGRRIGLFWASSFDNEEMHSHDFIEVVYIKRGRAVQYVGASSYEVSRGDILFINIGVSHSFVADGELEYVNVCFSPDVVGESIITRENAASLLLLSVYDELICKNAGGVISFSGSERAEIEEVFDFMLREYSVGSIHSDRIIESYMNVIITKMLRKMELDTGIGDDTDVWHEVAEYIDENYASHLSLSDLAKKCFYNPSYFSRMFKRRFNMSLTEYVSRKRIEFSTVLIEDGSFSTDEIAERVGYTDRSAFYRAFAKYTGMSVGEYRDSVKKKKHINEDDGV